MISIYDELGASMHRDQSKTEDVGYCPGSDIKRRAFGVSLGQSEEHKV